MLDDFRSEVHIFEPKLQHKFMDLKTHESIVRIFQHVLENKVFYEAFLANNPTSPFAIGLKEEIRDFVTVGNAFIATDDTQLISTRPFVIAYDITGFFESLFWWIMDGLACKVE